MINEKKDDNTQNKHTKKTEKDFEKMFGNHAMSILKKCTFTNTAPVVRCGHPHMLRSLIRQNKAGIILVGDITLFALSLVFTLLLRYGNTAFAAVWKEHFSPFLVLLCVWIFVFYIAGLYTYTTFRTTIDNAKLFGTTLLVNFFLSIGIFYAFSDFFQLTPKINLVIFTLLFAVSDGLWRYLLARILSSKHRRETILFVATSPLITVVQEHLTSHPQLGIVSHTFTGSDSLSTAVTQKRCDTVVVDAAMIKNAPVAKSLYELFAHHIKVQTLGDFYESLFNRVPLSEIEEEWFVQEMGQKTDVYGSLRQLFDTVFAITLVIILSPLFCIVAILVVLTSHGPIIYRQQRIGKDGEVFTLYKFRNMYHRAEKNPDATNGNPTWWQSNDARVTPVGKLLRKTHLDELPQLLNIIKGDMLLVGPRPERPEFVATLEEQIPHYMIRHIIKPGITGWAQVQYHYGGSVAASATKLEYDIYYLKHRSFVLDALILLKTLRHFF